MAKENTVIDVTNNFFRVNGNVAEFTGYEAETLENLASSISDTVWADKKDPGFYHTIIARDTTLPSNKDYLFVVSKTRATKDSPFTYYFGSSNSDTFCQTQNFSELEIVVKSYVDAQIALKKFHQAMAQNPSQQGYGPATLALVVTNP